MSSAFFLQPSVNEITLSSTFVIWPVEVNIEVSSLHKSERPNFMHSFSNIYIFLCTCQSNLMISCRRTRSLVSLGKLPCTSTWAGLLLLTTSLRKSISPWNISVVLPFAAWIWITAVCLQCAGKDARVNAGRDREQTAPGEAEETILQNLDFKLSWYPYKGITAPKSSYTHNIKYREKQWLLPSGAKHFPVVISVVEKILNYSPTFFPPYSFRKREQNEWTRLLW